MQSFSMFPAFKYCDAKTVLQVSDKSQTSLKDNSLVQ